MFRNILMLVFAALLVAFAAPAAARDIMCTPKVFGGKASDGASGEGYVTGPGWQWQAEWCPERWYWVRNYTIMPAGPITHPPILGMTPLTAVRTYVNANAAAKCFPANPASLQAVCDAMDSASMATLPPLPTFVVAAATAADGTRPTYLLTQDATGKTVLTLNTKVAPVRVLAGTVCDGYWLAYASGSTNYLSVSQPYPKTSAVLAVCVKKSTQP